MSEPKRITHHMRETEGAHYEGPDAYAKDVLLIAEGSATGRNAAGSEENGAHKESLDVESVVRKLIALLDEQQP